MTLLADNSPDERRAHEQWQYGTREQQQREYDAEREADLLADGGVRCTVCQHVVEATDATDGICCWCEEHAALVEDREPLASSERDNREDGDR